MYQLESIVALDTAPPTAFALQILLDGSPVARVGVDLQPQSIATHVFLSAVALHTDIALCVAGLAGAQITTRLAGVIACPDIMAGQKAIGMAIPAVGRRKIGVVGPHAGKRNIPCLTTVGIKLQIGALKSAVAGGAISLIVATVATLGTGLGPQGVNLQEITAVAARHVVPPVIARGQLGIDPAAGMAIKAEGLGVALITVAGPPLRQQAMTPQPGGIMIRRNSLGFMAVIAFGNLHGAIILVVLLIGNCLCNGDHGQGREQGQQQEDKRYFLHR